MKGMNMKCAMKLAFQGFLAKEILAGVALLTTVTAFAAFRCNIQVPAGAVGVQRTATVTCSNEGTSSIAAPYVRLEAGDNAFVRFS